MLRWLRQFWNGWSPWRLRARLMLAHQEWAETHTYLQRLCESAGLETHLIYGDSYGVPDTADLAASLAAQIPLENLTDRHYAAPPDKRQVLRKAFKKIDVAGLHDHGDT